MRLLLSAVLAAAAAAPLVMPVSRAIAAEADARGTVTIQAGTGRVMHLRAPASNIFTADPKVAEVRPASSDSLFVWGVAPGTTTIAALSDKGEAIAQFQVNVVPSGYPSRQVSSDLARVPPGQPVRARETAQGIELSGNVATARDAARAVSAATGQLPGDGKVVNDLTVAEPQQVSLHVRIAEMNRTLTRELGVNWSGANDPNSFGTASLGKSVKTGIYTNNPVADSTVTPNQFALQLVHGFNLETIISALSDDSLIHLLAEPNLTTMSGEPANFLVGGEFPVPVATNANTVSVEFKQYGISLSFVPTVLAHGAISLHVRPEVSQLDKANGVTFFFGTTNNSSGLSIPGLDVRRADTTVQLGSGQSFVIAGLLQDQTTLTGNAVPGLGDVPILGALFRSDSFQRNQSELVIIVTPYLVKPVSDPSSLHAPTDGWQAPNDIERILYLRQAAPGYPGTRAARRIPADAGFMVE
jgi:pilus assembly protein CpaC